jgi:hypothetical protein
MQHTKHEQFPTPVSGDGRPKKHFQNTHTMQTAVPHSKHGQYEKVGEKKFHLYRTAYRKFTYKCKIENYLPQNMLLVA